MWKHWQVGGRSPGPHSRMTPSPHWGRSPIGEEEGEEEVGQGERAGVVEGVMGQEEECLARSENRQ
jgi:hypothetical protein